MKIMEACVPLFLEKGYYDTTIKDILTAANVAHSSFFNIFPTKDALLLEYVKYMFPALIYAVETSIQLAVIEMKETLRSIYVEAYSAEGSLNYIIHHTAMEVQKLFGQYFPESNSESDFYERVIGSSGMMRGYMVVPCDLYFTLEKKIQRFLEMSLTSYRVPLEEQKKAIGVVLQMDLKTTAEGAIQSLTAKLRSHFTVDPAIEY
jgi:AcrR family transcriptional regulator